MNGAELRTLADSLEAAEKRRNSEYGAIVVSWPNGTRLAYWPGRGGHNTRLETLGQTRTTGNSNLFEAIKWAANASAGL